MDERIKITDLPEAEVTTNDDKFIMNVEDQARQVTVANISKVVKTEIGSIKNPHKLNINGAVSASYDGSEEVNVDIPSIDDIDVIGGGNSSTF